MKCLGAWFGVLQRTKGQSAASRSDYQRFGFVVSGTEIKLYGDVGDTLHLHKIFLPNGAPKYLNSAVELWSTAASAERRRDAVEARTVDVTLPQNISLKANLEISCAIAQHFANRGVGVQLDVQSSIASDGSDNIHAHLILTVRKIHADGFDRLKDRELERSFWAGRFRGREMREFLVEIINSIAVKRGYPLQVFAESHFERGLAPPEVRLDRWVFTNPQAEISIQKLEELSEQRDARKQHQDEKHEPVTEPEVAGPEVAEPEVIEPAVDDNDDDMIDALPSNVDRWQAVQTAQNEKLKKEAAEKAARQAEIGAETLAKREALNAEFDAIRNGGAKRKPTASSLQDEAVYDPLKRS